MNKLNSLQFVFILYSLKKMSTDEEAQTTTWQCIVQMYLVRIASLEFL